MLTKSLIFLYLIVVTALIKQSQAVSQECQNLLFTAHHYLNISDCCQPTKLTRPGFVIFCDAGMLSCLRWLMTLLLLLSHRSLLQLFAQLLCCENCRKASAEKRNAIPSKSISELQTKLHTRFVTYSFEALLSMYLPPWARFCLRCPSWGRRRAGTSAIAPAPPRQTRPWPRVTCHVSLPGHRS